MTALLAGSVPAHAWQAAAAGASENVSRRTSTAGPPIEYGAAGPPADRWQKIIEEIIAMQRFGNDWDGQGALAPSPELLESALGLVNLLRINGVEAPAAAVPGVDGSVTLVWNSADGTYCEVEIDRPVHAEVMLIEPGLPAKHWTLPN